MIINVYMTFLFTLKRAINFIEEITNDHFIEDSYNSITFVSILSRHTHTCLHIRPHILENNTLFS